MAAAFPPRPQRTNVMATRHVVSAGHYLAATAGMQTLRAGGNAFDAIVAAALTATIAAPYQAGIGGYGGSAMLATAGGKRITAIEFNSMAPSWTPE